MTDDNIYKGITKVMQITPDSIEQCQPCVYLPINLADAINHYISKHGWKLLHIGSQSRSNGPLDVNSDIIALLGK